MCLSEFDAARPLLDEADEGARAGGDEGTRAHVLFHRFQVEWFTGRWDTAGQLATAGLELADQLRDEQYRGIALYARALLDAHRGDEHAAEEGALEAVRIADALSDALFAVQSKTVLGFLELSRGDATTADTHLHALPGWLDDHGWLEPTDFAWTNAIEAMIETGRLEDARDRLQRYEELAKRSRSPWALATASRGRGLLWAASGDLDRARDALDRALIEHERMQCPFEHGRTLLALGTVRRRARERRSAREALDRARSVFDDLGARLWAARARSELERISGRRPGSDELTATEAQVVALVRDGLANKEIAAALHVSVHTVEAHLTRIYRKLGVRSRTTLMRRLSADDELER
jgi:ATP/maltotriose-dependent transcriptional regulator MalT